MKLYFGFRQSIEDLKLVLGLKIASVKLMFPFQLIAQDSMREFTSTFLFMGLKAWLLRRYTAKKEAARIEEWKRSTLVALKNKYEDTLSLIKGRADANQAQLRGRVFIMRALYGSKPQI